MLLSASGGTRSSAAAARMPSANSSSWTMPYPTRDTPATIAPAAISESPVTRIAPGSRMASGGSRVRRAPSTRPAEAAPNTRQATRKRRDTGQQRRQRPTAAAEPGQPQHDHRPDGRQDHVRRTGLQDQPDPDRGEHPGESGQPGRVPLGSTPQRGQPLQRLTAVDDARPSAGRGSAGPRRPGPAAASLSPSPRWPAPRWPARGVTPVGPAATCRSGCSRVVDRPRPAPRRSRARAARWPPSRPRGR